MDWKNKNWKIWKPLLSLSNKLSYFNSIFNFAYKRNKYQNYIISCLNMLGCWGAAWAIIGAAGGGCAGGWLAAGGGGAARGAGAGARGGGEAARPRRGILLNVLESMNLKEFLFYVYNLTLLKSLYQVNSWMMIQEQQRMQETE